MAVKYVDPSRWLPGIPARDLSDEDIEKLPLDEKGLIATGLYKKARKTDKDGDE